MTEVRPKFDEAGLLCAVIQDAGSGRVLMVGYMDTEALDRTRDTGFVTFWSRSRQEYWRKGETSGNVLRVRSIEIDCDGDALLVHVDPAGPTCHTGAISCFDAGGAVPLPGLGTVHAPATLTIEARGGSI